MPLPVAGFALRVGEPPGFLAGEADDDDIGPVVVVHVVGEGEEVIGVAGDVERLRRVVFVAVGVVWAGVPVRAVDDVHHAVVIEVAESGAFGEELVAELEFIEGVDECAFRLRPLARQAGRRSKLPMQPNDFIVGAYLSRKRHRRRDDAKDIRLGRGAWIRTGNYLRLRVNSGRCLISPPARADS